MFLLCSAMSYSYAQLLSSPQVRLRRRVELRSLVQQTADDDNVVEVTHVVQVVPGDGVQAAARAHGLPAKAHDGPAAVNLAAAVAFIRGETQHVQKARKRRQGEVAREQKANRQTWPCAFPRSVAVAAR